MLKKKQMKLFTLGCCGCLFLLAAGPLCAADSDELVKQIQKNFSSIKRQIVTQPKNAETALSETMELFDQLKIADPENSQNARLEGEIDKLNRDLAKRLGRNVKPVATTMTAPKAVAPASTATTPATMSAPPATGADLPSAVVSRIKKIDQSLDKAKKALATQSLQRAQLEFKAAARTYEEIQSRYQDQAPASHPEMVAVSERMATVNAQIETAANSIAADQVAGAESAAANQALADEWIAKMTPFLSRESDKYLDQTGWGKGEADFAKIRLNYGEAASLFSEYQKIDFPQGKPIELKNTEHGLKSVLDNLRETYAREDTEKASEEWLNRLEPFVTSMGSKTLIVSFTSSVEQMQNQKAIFDEANQLFAQYLKAEFPLGKSMELQSVESELADRLAKFPETLQRSIGAQSDNAEQKLDQEISFLQSKQEWKNDASKRPYCLSDERISEAQTLVDTAAGFFPEGDAGLVRVQDKMATLIQMNNERRKIHAERTHMGDDIFSGDGKNDIKRKAENLVTEKIRGCNILRSVVISEDWKEESLQEWTDTTQTATRFRTTRSVTAQVAAKKSDGEVRLYTLAIAKDRSTDGNWGKLYGNLHSDLGDLMLEKNVDK